MTAQADAVEACRRGDEAAFRWLFEAHRTRVYSTARHILGQDAAAKDVAQHVFVTLWREIGRIEPTGELSTWLYRVTVNACLNERRRLKWFVSAPPPDRESGAGQEGAVLARQVRDALAGLSAKLRIPIVLRHVEGLSYDEIAAVLGCSLGTVASRLSRGHQALASLLREIA